MENNIIMFKTVFKINSIPFNVSFIDKNLFEKHRHLDNFQDIKTIIYFAYRGLKKNITINDIKFFGFYNFEDKDIDLEITTTFLII